MRLSVASGEAVATVADQFAIPARCTHRPLAGGRVVPHISVVLADGRPVLGAVHRSKAMRCISEFRCQICGDPLGSPMVVFVTDAQLADRYSPEAALHPECAAYSRKACPVLAGQVDTLRGVDRHVGSACSEPGCDCAGWVASDGPSVRGREVGRWWAVWLDSYAIAVNERHEVHGLSWRDVKPRRVREVETAGGGSRG
ncbi:hypothetical protein [Polymorphospora lycopeni]|uniref:Uncharacterized protein n=1 Tax=Polymorphospora lycopeni TaxID=3140240 RepID=A0ABV5CKN8_9ACTN